MKLFTATLTCSGFLLSGKAVETTWQKYHSKFDILARYTEAKILGRRMEVEYCNGGFSCKNALTW